MIPSREYDQRLGVIAVLLSTWAAMTAAIDLNYCASINTGETSRNISNYQTNGLCHDWCIDGYAFAITQDNACWCSNYAPAEDVQTDLSDCDTTCPAYPDEFCGGRGVYGYVELPRILPSGTQGASTSADETSTAIKQVTETVQNTVTVVKTTSTTTFSSTSTSTADKTSTKTTSSAASTADSEATSVVQTVTADGTVKTIFLEPTNTGGSAANDNSGITVHNNGLKTGEVVGIVVGVIAAVIVAAGIALFFWFRRRKQRNEQDYQDDPSIRDSSSGMAASGRPEMALSGGSPISQSVSAITRNSGLLPADPRMNPFKEGLYMRSASHESVNTLRDDHDYSRRIQPPVLRATNPDPEHT